MSTGENAPSIRGALNRQTAPVFMAFFFWSFGTGGLWVVRPLFAYETGGTFLLVALASAVSVMPRMLMGPLAGVLADRYGRRPFLVVASTLHIVALTGQFFSDSYLPFLLLEVLGGTGIAFYMTSSNVLMADATRTSSRGRAVAVRQISTRVGTLLGPFVAGWIALVLGLSYIFLFIAATKAVVIVVTVLWVREMRSAPLKPTNGEGNQASKGRDLSMFKTRAFLVLGVSTLAIGLVSGGTGAFRTLFAAQGAEVGLSAAEVGSLIGIAGLFAVLASLPTGFATDRLGRKPLLVFGLIGTAVATYLMSGMSGFESAIVAVVIFGSVEAVALATTQVYAMDQAPEDRRGAFLGVWTMFTNTGQITGPLVIGGIADVFGFDIAFMIVTLVLALSAALVWALGPKTTQETSP
jgi:MFS family permease